MPVLRTLPQDPNGALRASADTERRIDSEVVSVLKEAYGRVTALLVRLPKPASGVPLTFVTYSRPLLLLGAVMSKLLPELCRRSLLTGMHHGGYSLRVSPAALHVMCIPEVGLHMIAVCSLPAERKGGGPAPPCRCVAGVRNSDCLRDPPSTHQPMLRACQSPPVSHVLNGTTHIAIPRCFHAQPSV